MLTKRESLAETRLLLKINLYVTIWTSAILAERLLIATGSMIPLTQHDKKTSVSIAPIQHDSEPVWG